MIFAAVRGYHEGMIHIRAGDGMISLSTDPGVRAHIHHKYYHAISTIRTISGMILSIYLVSNWSELSVLLLAGAALAGWEMTELGYSFARQGKLFMYVSEAGHINAKYENINFFDIYKKRLYNNDVVDMHTLRTVFGIMFMFCGIIFG